MVTLDGRDVTDVPANKRDMGMVFQATASSPHLSARDNVAFGLKLRGKRRATGYPARPSCSSWWACPRTPTSTPQNCPVANNSASRWPGAGDRAARAAARRTLPRWTLPRCSCARRSAAQTEIGITTLFVTHDQEEALAVADRGMMSHGRLEQIAAPVELYARLATPFVADFVGLNNELPCQQVIDGSAHLLWLTLPTLPGSVSAGRALRVRPEVAVTVTVDPGGPATVTSVSFMGAISRCTANSTGCG